MKEITALYENMGISPAVYAYGEAAIARLKERFDAIDKVAEYNQAKVLAAFRKNRVSATCFAASSGYGYNDEGRQVVCVGILRDHGYLAHRQVWYLLPWTCGRVERCAIQDIGRV